MIVSERVRRHHPRQDSTSRLLGRSTQGVKVMNLADGDRVSAVARMVRTRRRRQEEGRRQGMLDLSGWCGEASEEDPVDIGVEDEMDESLVDGDE
jgi:DNA gyrase subunit A